MNQFPKWTPRNPLEVIAIFIAMIYGICALLLGVAVGTLTEANQTSMVWFIVIFPICVLLIFGWLVRNHHTKLYAPGDYRSDDAFHGKQASAATLAERLHEEDTEREGGLDAVGEADVEQEGGDQIGQSEISVTSSVFEKPVAATALSAYLAEGLAFQELQKEFNASVRRHINLPADNGGIVTVDGAIETPTGMAVVEVKILRHGVEYSRRIRSTFDKLSRINLNSRDEVRLIAVFVLEDEAYLARVALALQDSIQNSRSHIETRLFMMNSLVEKYGFNT